MTTIAHLTDLHLIEPAWRQRTGEAVARLRFCSLLRPRDSELRCRRLRQGLWAAARARADHLMITGDLTEDGHDQAFESLATELVRGPIPPEAVTLVPGNHDAYADGAAFDRALAGPLRPWARTSRPGVVTRLGSTVLVPLSSAFHQHYLRSAGALGSAQLRALWSTVSVPAFARGIVVLAMHHPPFGVRVPPMQWLDGLLENRSLRRMLDDNPHVHVLHGHTHRAEDRALRPGRTAQVFSAAAAVEVEDSIRVYEVADGRLFPKAPVVAPSAPVPACAVVAVAQ